MGTPAGVIVDEASADLGLYGRSPIPIDADHIKIVKPLDRSAVQYARTREFVSENPPRAEQSAGCEISKLPTLKLEQPWNIVPKLMRLAVLALVCVIAFKGIQALIAPPPPVNTERLEQKVDELKALTEQLVAGSVAKAAPGTVNAVGAAVAVAAKGAAEGDERLAKALDLLKANKVAEAEVLFNAVAAEKAARIKLDSKEAAAAYRNLGAIAGLRDPKRALDAYAKAFELDANDIESLLWVAWFENDRGNLSGAETHYQRVLALATTDDRASYRYWALLGLGDIRMQRGNLPDALKSYRDGLAIADRLAQADPGNAGWQRDLSVSYAKIGVVFQRTGNNTEALNALREGHAIIERMTRLSPDNVQWKQDLNWFDKQIAGANK